MKTVIIEGKKYKKFTKIDIMIIRLLEKEKVQRWIPTIYKRQLPQKNCPECGEPMQKQAYYDGEGYFLGWYCGCLDEFIEINRWPLFFGKWATNEDLTKMGYEIV